MNNLDDTVIKKAMARIKTTDYRGTQTPQGIQEPTRSFDEIASIVESYLPNSTTALKIALAIATAGTRKNRVMLWLLFVGSPSSGKTDLLRLLRLSNGVYSLDTLTLNAFISGERATEKQQVFDLLPSLDGKCLILKDWTVIFSLSEEMSKKLIGEMVGVYDKSYSKHSSRRGTITYDSEFSHLGAITPSTLNKHHNYLNMIGPRFLHYIIPDMSESEENDSFKAIFSNENRQEKEDKARLVVSGYLNQLNATEFSITQSTGEIQNYLRVASRFVCRARGIVIVQAGSFVNEKGENISYYEPLDVQIEQPWRAIQQLLIFANYLAFVVGKTTITSDELEIIKEVVLSSMPADRAQALKALVASENHTITRKQLADQLDKSTKTAGRLLDELVFLGVLSKQRDASGQLAASYSIVDEFKAFLTVHPSEFMSAYSSGDKAGTFSTGSLGSLASPEPTNGEAKSEKTERSEQDKFLDEMEAIEV